MKSLNFASIFFLVIASTLVSGCATLMRAPSPGLFYTDSQAGLVATANQAGNRVGEACNSNVLGVSTGDASIEAARRNGGITMITSVDETFHSVFIFYAKHCTVVRGR